MGSFSVRDYSIVLVIVLLVFGTKKLRNIGSDLGGAVKGFKDGMKNGEEKPADASNPANQIQGQNDGKTVDVQAKDVNRG